MSVNDTLLDQVARHQHGLMRVSAATVRKVLAQLARVEADLLAQLRADDLTEFSQSRLERQLTAIQTMHRQEYASVTGMLSADLDALAVYEAEFIASRVGSLLDVAFDVPTRADLVAAVNSRPFQGRFLREWMAGLGEDQARRVRDAVRMGYIEGDSLQTLIGRIRGTKAAGYKDGIMEIGRRAAERITRTAINHTANRAREAAFADLGSDLVKGVQWSSVMDSRTSLVCGGRDGKVYPLDSGPRPPAHFNCRSAVTMVLDGFPPADRVTYDDWLKRQDTATQDEILGTERAKLWRNGDVKLDRFVDRKGEPWTLDELRKREGL
jgi:SPP1 gp7 family putative phage head morphogenesis protein